MGLGTNHQTISTHDIFLPEVWGKRAQRAREAALHLASFVYRQDDMVSSYGDTINDQTISNLSANNKTAGAEVTLQTPSESAVTLSVNKHKEASFLVEDNLAFKSMIKQQREYTTKGAYAVGKQIDTDLFALYASLSESAIGTATSALTQAVAALAWETLSTNDVPEEDRGWFFHPSAFADLIQITAFTSIDFKEAIGGLANSGMNGLKVGYMYGAPVYITTNVPSATTGSPAQTYYRNLYLHKEAFQLAMQKNIRTQISYIQEYLGYLTTIDAVYGVAIYRADHGVEIDV